MTPHEGDVPAMNLTLREQAALTLRVPDSGTPWIDGMIRKALRQEFAKAAMQGMVAHPDSETIPADRIADCAVEQADALMAEMEKGR